MAPYRGIVWVCCCHGRRCFCCQVVQLTGSDTLVYSRGDLLSDKHLVQEECGRPSSAVVMHTSGNLNYNSDALTHRVTEVWIEAIR